MRKRRPTRGLGRNRSGGSRSFRLVLEPLEARRLLAGLQVSVYLDQDNSRSYDAASDEAAPQRLVYLDLNSNDVRDPDEPVAVTDAEGRAFFDDLASGRYSVGLLTNADVQPQVDPVSLALPQQVATLGAAEDFVASDDLSVAWSFSPTGVLRRIVGKAELPSELPLGRVAAAVRSAPDQLSSLVAVEGGWQWIDVQLDSGRIARQPLTGATPQLTAAVSIESLVKTETHAVALLGSSTGNLLASFGPPTAAAQSASGGPQVALHGPTAAYALAGSLGSPYLATLSDAGQGESRLSLLDPVRNFAPLVSLDLAEHATDVTLSSDGGYAFVSLSAGGVLAVAVTPRSLVTAAILHDAAGQVVASAADGRIVTGSIRSPREVIIWDRRSWQPVARSSLATGDTLGGWPRLAVEAHGDRLLALAGGRLQSVDLAKPINRTIEVPAEVSAANGVQQVRLGLRPPQAAADLVPTSPIIIGRAVAEDQFDSFRMSDLAAGDFARTTLWAVLEADAEHGQLIQSEDGLWTYIPGPDFFGTDTARVKLYDGQQSAELAMQWQVSPQPDPPTGVAGGDYSLLETAEHGTRVGPLAILDPDLEGSYLIATSDSRFQVQAGYLVFVAGSLDFETEPLIEFTVTAFDYYSDHSVSTMVSVAVIDVNEAPFSLQISGRSVPENEPGAVVGQVTIVDPDAHADYAFYVFDSRFRIDNRMLQLAPGVAVDYEAEPVVQLTVAATDGTHEIHAVVAIQVLNRREDTDSASLVELHQRQVQELVRGAPVGRVSVVAPRDDRYTYTVSDSRFEIVGDVLKLQDHQVVVLSAAATISLSIDAVGEAGDRATGSFVISVLANPSPYHNTRLPEDVNGDGMVSPIDVLIVVNELNLRGTFPVPMHGGVGNGEAPADMPDVNGDGVVSPVDALIIINRINRSFPAGSGLGGGEVQPEGESSPALDEAANRPVAADDAACPVVYEDGSLRRKRDNLSLDSELELLLDQLSRVNRL